MIWHRGNGKREDHLLVLPPPEPTTYPFSQKILWIGHRGSRRPPAGPEEEKPTSGERRKEGIQEDLFWKRGRGGPNEKVKMGQTGLTISSSTWFTSIPRQQGVFQTPSDNLGSGGGLFLGPQLFQGGLPRGWSG